MVKHHEYYRSHNTSLGYPLSASPSADLNRHLGCWRVGDRDSSSSSRSSNSIIVVVVVVAAVAVAVE